MTVFGRHVFWPSPEGARGLRGWNIGEVLSDTRGSMTAAEAIFQVQNKQPLVGTHQPCLAWSSRRAKGSCSAKWFPSVAGSWGASGGSERASGVLGFGAAFIYPSVRKCLSVLTTCAASYEQAEC